MHSAGPEASAIGIYSQAIPENCYKNNQRRMAGLKSITHGPQLTEQNLVLYDILMLPNRLVMTPQGTAIHSLGISGVQGVDVPF